MQNCASRVSDEHPFARRWDYAILVAILLLAAFLRFFRLQQEGYANLYYAAGVQSMLTSWHNFFFVAFDAAGFVSIDKPPLGLWIQAASAALLGFHGWALLLPQAVAGVFSVLLIYHLVKRVFGPAAGLIAALTLAVTPISVAANRNNTQDSLVVCLLLLATWLLFLAHERDKPGWLVLAFVLIGLGFNIKMLQAYMVLPAFGLFYWLGAKPWAWRRVLQLALASLVMLAVSLAWAVVVDMTPMDQRPYVGSSESNSVVALMTGHNGLARLLPGRRDGSPVKFAPNAKPSPPVQPGGMQPPPGGPTNRPSGTPLAGGALSNEVGAPGIFRLFNHQLAGQMSWLLPLAGCGALALFLREKLRLPLPPTQHATLFWAAWLLPQMAFFSVANLFHRYYLEMLAPAVAALVGAGAMALWRDYRARNARAWWLPVALLATMGLELFIVWDYPDYRAWLAPILLVGCGLASVGLIYPLLKSKPAPGEIFSVVSAILGLILLLVAPTVWAWIPVWHGGDAWLPFAGPDVLTEQRVSPTQLDNEQLVTFLQAHYQGETFLLATLNARDAAPIILETAKPVMAIGGFSGSDVIVTPPELATMVQNGELRFFLLPGGGPGHPNGGPVSAPMLEGLSQPCTVVPAAQWAGMNLGPGMQLWDCQ